MVVKWPRHLIRRFVRRFILSQMAIELDKLVDVFFYIKSVINTKFQTRQEQPTTEQLFNLRVLVEKYLEHQNELFHNFIDFKKAFDRA